MQNVETYAPQNQKEWRKWLIRNHVSKPSIWLVLYKKQSKLHNLIWSNAVDEALCFGWVDGRRKPVDEDKFIQFFCKRKENSTWSKVNKEKVRRLIKQGLMTSAGLTCIEKAKQNGSWTILDDVEDLVIPPDLQAALEHDAATLAFFNKLSISNQKLILRWVKLCKTDKTRQLRIRAIVDSAKLLNLPAALNR